MKLRTGIRRKTYILLPCFLEILPWLPIMPLQAWTDLYFPAEKWSFFWFGRSIRMDLRDRFDQALRIGSCLACVYRVMDARGKFGEHERSARVARGAAESNFNFLSALQTSQVHPWLNIRTAKSMNQFFYNIATKTWALKHFFISDWPQLVLTMHDEGKQRS